MQICSIYDSKAEAYLTPMFFQAVGQALRSFTDAINDAGTEFNKHPEDYGLFHLGSFDPLTGTIELNDMPTNITVGHNVTNEPEQIRSLA